MRPKFDGKDKVSNWNPAPEEEFLLYIRCYWRKKVVLDGTWIPPQIERVK